MGVFKIILYLISATVVSCTEYVPVLLWSTQATEESLPDFPALQKLSSNEFSDYLLKRVKVEKPLILAFMEENLSVEDFSWKDLNGNGAYPMLNNITRVADEVTFLPSVHEPYKAFKKLRNHGYLLKNYEKDSDLLKSGKNAIYEVKLEEPEFLEDRPDMLKKHDEKMARIYNEAITNNPNVLVVYTGAHTSWINAELSRSKREDTGTNSSDSLVITDANNVVKIVTSKPIIFKNGDTPVEINEIHGDPTIKDDDKSSLIFRVRLPLSKSQDDFVEFNFTSTEGDWWTLNSAEISNLKQNLQPTVEIGAPYSYSYFCNPSVVFTQGNYSLIFENFQVQPRLGKDKPFGPIIHCVPYFSIAILSGLATVFILSVVLGWGITMIMDINTNDRFDDPKGKTITITATD